MNIAPVKIIIEPNIARISNMPSLHKNGVRLRPGDDRPGDDPWALLRRDMRMAEREDACLVWSGLRVNTQQRVATQSAGHAPWPPHGKEDTVGDVLVVVAAAPLCSTLYEILARAERAYTVFSTGTATCWGRRPFSKAWTRVDRMATGEYWCTDSYSTAAILRKSYNCIRVTLYSENFP